MPAWIERKLEFDDDDVDQDRMQLWRLCGLAPETVEVFVGLGVRYENGRLKIRSQWRGHRELADLLAAVMLQTWCWKKFSDSRWISFGASCRQLLGSLLLGLQDYVEEVLATPGTSTYHLRGFGFLDAEALRMTAVFAISSAVSDSALSMLLADDRLPLILQDFENDVREEAELVENLQDNTIAAVATACGVSTSLLRDQAAKSAWVQASFLIERVRAAHEPPWSLVLKPPDEALHEIEHGERPEEEVTQKLYDLLQLGYPRATLKRLLYLLSQASWSSTPVEQAHVVTSMLKRLHNNYGVDTLQTRSVLCSFATLLRPSVRELKIMRLERRLEVLAKRQPNKFTGRQCYVRDLWRKADDLRLRGRAIPSNMARRVIQVHGKRWKEMARGERAAFERRALLERGLMADALVEETRSLRAAIQQEKNLAAEDSSKAPLRMDSSRLPSSQKREFDQLAESEELSRAMQARTVSHSINAGFRNSRQ